MTGIDKLRKSLFNGSFQKDRGLVFVQEHELRIYLRFNGKLAQEPSIHGGKRARVGTYGTQAR